MQVTITIDGVERTYQGDYDEMHNVGWSEIIQERLDEALADEKNNHDEI